MALLLHVYYYYCYYFCIMIAGGLKGREGKGGNDVGQKLKGRYVCSARCCCCWWIWMDR